MTDPDRILAEAKAALKESGYQLRSCWNCNEAHEHLKAKDNGVILCHACGRWFYDGQDITVGTPQADPVQPQP